MTNGRPSNISPEEWERIGTDEWWAELKADQKNAVVKPLVLKSKATQPRLIADNNKTLQALSDNRTGRTVEENKYKWVNRNARKGKEEN